MIRFDEYRQYDATSLAALIREKCVTSLEVVDAAIEAIERINPKINAVVQKQFENAKELSHSPPCSASNRFYGVPFLLKDLGFQQAGIPMTNGSRALASFIPDANSEVVKRYRESGLIICGRTNTPEGGFGTTTEPILFGVTRNPWNLSRTPGGSSGGSAAAVASGMVPAAGASDGGGSIRIPASCCGLFGLKPTRSRVTSSPNGDPWNGLSIKHALTRSVRDSAKLLDITSGFIEGDPYAAPFGNTDYASQVDRSPGNLHIGLSLEPLYDQPISEDCKLAIVEAGMLCEELGHKVEEAGPRYNREAMRDAWLTIAIANHAADLVFFRSFLGREPNDNDLEPWTLRAIEMGQELTGVDVIQALKILHLESRNIAAFYKDYDLLLTPTLATPPIKIGQLNNKISDFQEYMEKTTAFSPFTRLANCTGSPSMNVPLYWNSNNLPIGVMFTGRFGQEHILFRLAGQLEKARPWQDRLAIL